MEWNIKWSWCELRKYKFWWRDLHWILAWENSRHLVTLPLVSRPSYLNLYLPQFTSFSFKKHFCKIFDVSERELFRYHRLRVCFTPPPFFPMVRPVIPKCSLCTDSPLGEGAFCEFFWGEGVLYTDYPKCLTSLYISCTIFAVATWKLFLQRHHLRRAFSHVLPSRDASSAMEDGGRGNCG